MECSVVISTSEERNNSQVAPVTARHILKLAKLGAYNSVHFFRVDKGFVAQTADVVYGRLEGVGLDARQMVSPVKLRCTVLQ